MLCQVTASNKLPFREVISGRASRKSLHCGGTRSRYVFRGDHPPTTADCFDVGYIAIDVFPDDVLVEIFDFCLQLCEGYEEERNASWEALVHVCRRWRYIVFAAPRRLGLRLVCTNGTRVKEVLDIWPALPIELRMDDPHYFNEDNAIATLGHPGRICGIYVQNSDEDSFERFAAAMQVSFPALTDISLWSFCCEPPTLPDSFLGGSALGLRLLDLKGVAAPGLPKLLRSTPNIVRLQLEDIPLSGFDSPYVMVDYLPSLTRLEYLRIVFSLYHIPDQTSLRPPPPTRIILPELNSLSFQGTSKYLEILFTWKDAPLHDHIYIDFVNPVIFDVPRISLFNARDELLQTPDQAHMHFNHSHLHVTLSSSKGTTCGASLQLLFKYRDFAWQLLFLSQSRSRFSPFLDFSSGRLDDGELRHSQLWTNEMENTQ